VPQPTARTLGVYTYTLSFLLHVWESRHLHGAAHQDLKLLKNTTDKKTQQITLYCGIAAVNVNRVGFTDCIAVLLQLM
jgi:hypothetical protein